MGEMEGWDLVFRAGWHTDSSGNKKLWTTDDLDKIVSTLNPAFHEPPVVIGHPSDNAPAFGWVEAAKRVGNDLYLKYRDVASEFKEWVGKGLFKKKSIAVYPDGSLRHIGYLGAMPPAIKGLPDYQFSDSGRGQAVTYEFSDWRMTTIGRIVMRLRDYMIEKEGAEKADSIISPWDIQDLLTPPPEPEGAASSYHENSEEESMKPEEVQALIDKALSGMKTQFQQFTEAVQGLSTQLNELKQGQVADREAGLRREFHEFLMTPEMQQRVPEGSRKATVDQMMTLVAAAPIEFGEGDNKTTKPALEVYKEQLKALPTVVAFKEFATGDRVGDLSVTGGKAQTDISRHV